LVYPENFEEKVGFLRIRKLLEDQSDTLVGKRLSREIEQVYDPASVKTRLAETDQFVKILKENMKFPDLAAVDIARFLKQKEPEGTCLDVEEWMEIRKLLVSIRQLLKFFKEKNSGDLQALQAWISAIAYSPVIHEKIDQVFNRQAKVRDQASLELKRIRVRLHSLTISLSKQMSKIITYARKEGIIDSDTQATLREGRLVIPLPATHKRKIKGLIHDESATGKTAFVEPVELVEINNEIGELERAEQREIVKILVKLTTAFRPYFEDLLHWNEVLGALDHIRARARLSMQWQGVMPVISKEAGISWKKVRHPLLLLVYKKEGRKVVPQNIMLNHSERVLIISGPNAGGKSVCLKTVGLVQYMIQFGLLPPMKEGSSSGIFTQFLMDIGDEQSIDNDLSTYSSHLFHMKNFLRKAHPDTLFLIDEFGTGTEPQLGGAIAESILEKLVDSQAFGVVTTHYANLKHFGTVANGVVNGAMLFDTRKMKPVFELDIGKPGGSFAFEIARTIGLPEKVLEKATELVGSGHIRFDKNLREIARDKRYWERKRQKIKKEEKEIEQLHHEYDELLKEVAKERKHQLREVKERAEEMLIQINRRIEKTIREIRESQADKAISRTARKKLNDYVTTVRDEFKKLESAGEQPEEQSRTVMQFQPGQKIRIEDRDLYGEVLEHRNESLMISIGQMITTINPEKVIPVSEEEFKRHSGGQFHHPGSSGLDLEKRKLTFSPQLDVRGLRAADALQKVTEFIDEAIMVGHSDLRIIHGKGDGILRQLIRDYLSGVDLVTEYRDEDIRIGGTGVTVVFLDF